MIASRLIPALAVLSVAAAQSICSATGTATITNSAQAAAYTGCKKIAGSIAISPSAQGIIELNGPTEIGENLIVSDVGELTTLNSDSIVTIGGSFTLTNLTKLSILTFNKLDEVKDINWITLQALDLIAFASNVTKADTVVIGNTFLSNLKGINLDTVNTLDISNNNRLRLFTSDLTTVNDTLVIGNNGQNLAVSFPELTFAANMTFRNISSIDLPNLTKVGGTLGFYGTFIKEVSAPKLTEVGVFTTGDGGLALVANSKLTEIDMPLLKSVGGAYQIANNTQLSNIEFPALERVGGAVDFSGTFSTPKLAKISDVRGGFNMQSTTEIDCSGFESLHSSKAIQGTFVCKSTVQDAKSNDGTTTTGDGTTTAGGATTSKSAGPAVTYGVNPAVAGVSVVGGLLAMLL